MDGKLTGGENIQFVGRNVVKRGLVDLEVFGKHFFRHVCKPVRQLEGRVFAEVTVVEDLGKGTVSISFLLAVCRLLRWIELLTKTNSEPSGSSSVA